MTRSKILNLFLILTSFVVYLEWGSDNKMFLIEGEIDLFSKIFSDPLSVIHPFIFLPLIGQLLLLITLFQEEPNRLLTNLGLFGLSVLILFIFFIGIISKNFKIALSTIPFLITAFLIIKKQLKKN